MSLKTCIIGYFDIHLLLVDTDCRAGGLREYRWLNDEENKNIIGR